MGNSRGFLSSLLIGCSVLVSVGEAKAADYLCYIAGANGLTSYVQVTIARILNSRGVPFIAFDPGDSGIVEVRGKRVMTQFEALLKKDASARCHIFGYSMGGVISRWMLNYGIIEGPNGPEKMRSRVLSQTTAASPHLGTPLAKILRTYWDTVSPGVEDLSEDNIRRFNDPNSPTYSPELPEIPAYSYRTFITDKKDADEPLVLLGFQLITQDRLRHHLDTTNDGIVPTDSQAFGHVLGDLNISHGYFHHTTKFKVSLEDFLEAHWNFLTKGTRPLIF